MKIAYFDCFSGISGDMVLGAFLNLGLDIKSLKKQLKKLPVTGYTITARHEKRHFITGTSVRIKSTKKSPERTFKDIKKLINISELSKRVKEISIAIFKTLAVAEAKVHGCKLEDVHFHEVGAIDSIVDIVGTSIGLEELAIEGVFASPLPAGSGWTKTSHGVMPVPAPATMELLKGMPVISTPVKNELTTPTGAAILKTLSRGFGTLPDMVIEATGYGVGRMDFRELPNLLRVVIGKSDKPAQQLIILETNIDDMNPQIYGYLIDNLLKYGALDAFLTPILMKKGRPAILLKVLCSNKYKKKLTDIILKETTTLGIRSYKVDRDCLERKEDVVSIHKGKIRVKISEKDGKPINIQPEYEDCRRIAKNIGMPLKEVMEKAKEAYRLKKKWQ